MMHDVERAPELAMVAAERTGLLVETLRRLDVSELEAASDLEGWSRLTVACHLRYGASALLRMTSDALAGRTTSYYPLGRVAQRSATLAPRPGEATEDVVASLANFAAELDGLWTRVGVDQWALRLTEPADNQDLGTIPLGRLAMSRLLEVDVHGTDLGIGFPDWSPTLIEVALPTRLRWLATRRTNHREFDKTLRGSWVLTASDGPSWFVAVDGDEVESRPAADGDKPSAEILGSSRDLLALLLGRPPFRPLSMCGDTAFGAAFSTAFPGP